MANNRKEYFRKTRKSRMRELKHSRTGWISMLSAFFALGLFIGSVVCSYLAAGEAQILTGAVSLIALVLAAGAVVLGIFAIREPKVRPVPPRTGLALGAVLTLALGGLYVGGMMGVL